jgi:hypothetical protein
MTSAAVLNWHEANQCYSMAALAEVRAALQALLTDADATTPAVVPDALPSMPDAAIETLAREFALSEFERKILLMCAGVELDSKLASLCAAVQGDALRTRPTFSLALAAFTDAHWSALSADGPLRYWRLLRMSAG